MCASWEVAHTPIPCPAVCTSVVFAGMLLGVSSLGVLADHLGRRRGFLASALLLGAAGLASALAPSLMVSFAAVLLARWGASC